MHCFVGRFLWFLFVTLQVVEDELIKFHMETIVEVYRWSVHTDMYDGVL